MAVRRLSFISLLAFCLLASEAFAESFWNEQELRILKSLSLDALESPPAFLSNRVADQAEAVKLGQQLFFDARLSRNKKIACASCHQPQKFFTDGKAYSQGMGQTHRNSPTLLGSAHQSWFYWDGRRDSLWSQALVPLEALDEMGSDRTAVVKLVLGNKAYRNQYEDIFGAFPTSLSLRSLPTNAGPYGDSETKDAWFRLDEKKRRAVNLVFSNIGKAIAAFERTLLPRPSRFDRYVAKLLTQGELESKSLLSEEERLGAKLFIDGEKTQCLQCHNGPMLTNGGFHNIGTGNFTGEQLDFGRELGLNAVLLDEFNCLGEYSDAKPESCSALRFLSKDAHVSLKGAFKTPTLRGLSRTAPYFHDGSRETLEDVVEHYLGISESPEHELKGTSLTSEEKKALTAFLKTL